MPPESAPGGGNPPNADVPPGEINGDCGILSHSDQAVEALEQQLRSAPGFVIGGHSPELVHVYQDATGTPLAASARFAPGTLEPSDKTFRQYRKVEQCWTAGLDGLELPLYRLPRVLQAIAESMTILVMEGEKCVLRALELGLVATTNPGGARHWKAQHTQALRGANVVVLPDKDAPGQDHGRLVADALLGVAASVRVLALPDLPEHGDIVDWLNAGGTRESLLALVEATPAWTASQGGWPKPTPFGAVGQAASIVPKDLLPEPLAEIAREIAETVMVDPGAPVVLLPVCISAAAGNAFSVRVSPAYGEPNVSRYVLWIKPSGERGSETFRRTTGPLTAYAIEIRAEYDKQLALQLASVTVARKRAEALEKQAEKAKDPDDAERLWREATQVLADSPIPPRPPIIFIGDTTSEQLVRMMSEQGGGFAVLSGEARQVVDQWCGRYRKDGNTDDSIYLQAHGGDNIDRARAGNTSSGELVVVPKPALALGICFHEDKLTQLATRPELQISGLLPRCQISRPRSRVGTRIETGNEKPMDPAITGRWERSLTAIIKRRFQVIDSEPGYRWKPIELVLDPEAMVRRREFANELERRQAPGGDLSHASAFASKAAGEAGRLAGLFHLFLLALDGKLDQAAQIPIALSTWEIAERHQRWQLAETLRVLSLAREDEATRTARRVLDWVSREASARRVVSARDVISARIVANQTEAQGVMEWLVERGWAREAAPTGRQQAKRWEMHPSVCGGHVA
jgi:putative DNA primase/helicase